jgi:hypothetical protein
MAANAIFELEKGHRTVFGRRQIFIGERPHLPVMRITYGSLVERKALISFLNELNRHDSAKVFSAHPVWPCDVV